MNWWIISIYISAVAPICYAHLAATQMGQFMKFEERSETASSHGGAHTVPQLPRLNDNVSSSMFFCWANRYAVLGIVMKYK